MREGLSRVGSVWGATGSGRAEAAAVSRAGREVALPLPCVSPPPLGRVKVFYFNGEESFGVLAKGPKIQKVNLEVLP